MKDLFPSIETKDEGDVPLTTTDPDGSKSFTQEHLSKENDSNTEHVTLAGDVKRINEFTTNDNKQTYEITTLSSQYYYYYYTDPTEPSNIIRSNLSYFSQFTLKFYPQKKMNLSIYDLETETCLELTLSDEKYNSFLDGRISSWDMDLPQGFTCNGISQFCSVQDETGCDSVCDGKTETASIKSYNIFNNICLHYITVINLEDAPVACYMDGIYNPGYLLPEVRWHVMSMLGKYRTNYAMNNADQYYLYTGLTRVSLTGNPLAHLYR